MNLGPVQRVGADVHEGCDAMSLVDMYQQL